MQKRSSWRELWHFWGLANGRQVHLDEKQGTLQGELWEVGCGQLVQDLVIYSKVLTLTSISQPSLIIKLFKRNFLV